MATTKKSLKKFNQKDLKIWKLLKATMKDVLRKHERELLRVLNVRYLRSHKHPETHNEWKKLINNLKQFEK
jgi:hypothetical protein